MSRPFALLLCLPLIIWLWKRDQRVRPSFSPALWIPLLSVLVMGSRPVSWWLGIGGSGGGDLEGGSWFDRLIYLGQIFASIYILSRRNIQWGALIGQNKAIFLFYGFLLLTMFWSPYPFVTFRRWFKDLGFIFVALVILTEQHPLEAIKAVFARCAFVWFPLSEIFNKYFPELGRGYTRSGGTMFWGVTQQKNTLGLIILVSSLVLISELLQANRPLPGRSLKGRRFTRFLEGHHFTILFTLAMGLWLLLISNSKTSQICLVMGTMIVIGHKLPFFKGQPRRILRVIFIAVPLLFIAESAFQISENILPLIGRNSTLTDRTEIWQAIRENPVDPIVGTGYLMYWDLHRRDVGFNIKTAHNGYIETYLDGGMLGIGFLIIMLVAVGMRAIREFLTGSEYGRLAFAFFAVLLLSNITESIYARRGVPWFAFLLFALEFRGCVPSRMSEETRVARDSWADEREAVGAVVSRRPS